MIVQCPRCSTRWRVGEPSGTDNPVFKCGRCHHVFPRFPGAPTAGERALTTRQRAPTAPQPDNLEFIFPRRTAGDGEEAALTAPEATVAPLSELVTDPPAAAELLARARAARSGDAATLEDLSAADSGVAPADGSGEASAAPETENDAEVDGDEAFDVALDGEFDDDIAPEDDLPTRDAGRVLRLEDEMRARGIRTVARALFMLLAVPALFTTVARLAPERAERWLGRLPLVGRVLGGDGRLGREIVLHDVRGGYQRLRNGRMVFVISGQAVNNSLSAVERVQVEGALYGAAGEVDRKIVNTGNEITLKLGELSEPEIALLQHLEPHGTLAPGERASFSIVFLEPLRGAREFSSRVLTARPTGRAPAHPPTERARLPASVG